MVIMTLPLALERGWIMQSLTLDVETKKYTKLLRWSDAREVKKDLPPC